MVLPTAEMKQATGRNPEAGLLSRESTAAVGSAFSTLTETVKKHEPTLEDVVRETLHPMLKSWLDENLPRLVEQMVQAEIERVTRGRYVFFAPRGGFAAIFVSKPRQSGAGQRALPLLRWQIDRAEDAGWSCAYRRSPATPVTHLSSERRVMIAKFNRKARV